MKPFLFAISLSLSFPSFSQSLPLELDPVSVSASLSEKRSSETGRNILLIRGEQFNNLPVHSIDELLRYVPGVEVQQRGPMGSQSDIVIRGGTFQQVLIVLDGLRLNDPNTGHFNSYIPIAPSEIDRIEILKGASSAIYGSEAVGGVIHIITKTFSAKLNQANKQLSVAATGGEYGLWSVNAGGSYQQGKTALSGGLLTTNSDGQPQRGTRGYLHNSTASFSFSRWLDPHWQLSLRSAYDTRRFSAQNFYTTYVSDTANEKVSTSWNQAQLVYEKDKSKFTFNLGYKAVRDAYAFTGQGVPNQNTSTLFQALAVYEHPLRKNAQLVSGVQFQDRAIRSNDRGNHGLQQAAAFVILDQNFGGSIFISPALRLDWDEKAGTELVPQLTVSYKKGKLQLRGSAGTTIRQADFTERYNNYNKALVTSGSIGNPNLQAERSFSYEVGADYFIKGSWKLSATAFRREQSDVIDWITTPYSELPRTVNLSPAGVYALAENIATVTTSGVEADLQYNHPHLRATLGLVWLGDKTSSASPSFYISSHAKFLTNFSVLYSLRGFFVSVNGVYKHRAPQQASAIDAKVSADCFLLHTNVGWKYFFIEVDNLGDSRCADLLGTRLPGRWWMGGVRWKLGK